MFNILLTRPWLLFKVGGRKQKNTKSASMYDV
jgi:hypothetical protein